VAETRSCRVLPTGRKRGGRASSIALTLCVLGILSSPASAQVVVDPLTVTISNAAAARTVVKVTVRNPHATSAQIVISRGDWNRTESGENQFLPYGSTSASCGALLSVYPLSLRIDPNGAENLYIAYEGSRSLTRECWNAFFLEEPPRPSRSQGSTLQYVLRTAVKVHVVPPGATREGAIEGISIVNSPSNVPKASPRPAGRKIVVKSSGRSLSISFRNLGGVHLATRGNVQFRRLDNSVAAEIPVDEFPTLPGARRNVLVEIPQLSAGRYVVLAMLDFGGAEIAAGEIEIAQR
jgi:P pilus assembly chaperone PapD